MTDERQRGDFDGVALISLVAHGAVFCLTSPFLFALLFMTLVWKAESGLARTLKK